jgi:hypothetical protein
MQGGPWYATREMVKGASDVRETARFNRAIDRNLAKASRDAESLLLWPHFYPILATRYFDWPNRQMSGPWTLWLDGNPLISLSAVTSGGDPLVVGSDLFLEPANYGPPYDHVRINSDSQASWSSGDSGEQRALALTGLWGRGSNFTTGGTTLTAAISTTSALVADVSNSAIIGIGDLIEVDSERMVVTGKQTTDTGVNSSGALAGEKNAQALSVSNGTAFEVEEVITIDSERMRIDDITGNTLIVTRAWDGTTLAAHNTNSDIYAPRRLLLAGRGFGGTTAATHTLGTTVYRWVPPQSLSELVLAEAQNAIAQENAAWARVIGVGEAQREAFARGLVDLRKQVRRTLGRQARKAAI